MKYRKTTLKNELRVITVPMPTLESATVTIWVGVGSRFESDRIAGISHFLEHMVFKGSKKRPTAKLIAEAIDSFGGEFNASTSKEWTNFYIKAPVARLATALDVLSDMVLRPLLKTEDLEREKGVILEEIAMYEDTPMAHIDDIFERLIFKGNSLGRDVIGTRQSVKGVGRSDFVSYRDVHYGSNNVVVTVSGGINERKTINMVESYLSELSKKTKKKAKVYKAGQKKPALWVEYKKGEQAHLILGFHGNPLNHPERFAESVLTAILGQGMSSRMFTEVREKRGLAYAVRTSSDHNVDCGYLSTYAGVDLKRVDDAVKVILEQYYLLRDEKEKISKKELSKAKEYLKGHLALSLEDTKSVNGFFGLRELLLGKVDTPDDIYKGIDKVTVDDVLKVARKFFQPERLNFAIIGPYKDGGRFEKLMK